VLDRAIRWRLGGVGVDASIDPGVYSAVDTSVDS
jgi:hypothetical protein